MDSAGLCLCGCTAGKLLHGKAAAALLPLQCPLALLFFLLLFPVLRCSLFLLLCEPLFAAGGILRRQHDLLQRQNIRNELDQCEAGAFAHGLVLGDLLLGKCRNQELQLLLIGGEHGVIVYVLVGLILQVIVKFVGNVDQELSVRHAGQPHAPDVVGFRREGKDGVPDADLIAPYDLAQVLRQRMKGRDSAAHDHVVGHDLQHRAGHTALIHDYNFKKTVFDLDAEIFACHTRNSNQIQPAVTIRARSQHSQNRCCAASLLNVYKYFKL